MICQANRICNGEWRRQNDIKSALETHRIACGQGFSSDSGGGEFTYDVPGNFVNLPRTNRHIPRKDFEEAYNNFPLKNTSVLQHLQGPSYIYAILSDERITGKSGSVARSIQAM
jgi:hypothetical protein